MIAYIIKRLLIAVPVLLGVSLVAFFLVRLAPGDTVDVMMGMHRDEALAERLRQQYGLDRSLPEQYFIWLGHVVRGDLGRSFVRDVPVTTLIAQRLPVTLQLATMSVAFAVVVGVPLGIVSALRRAQAADYAASFAGLVGISVPGFWLGTLLILVFSVWMGALPSGGFVPLLDDVVENLRHMILPTLALGAVVAAVVMRMTRSSVLEVVRQDYVRTARAKGLSERVVITRHALRNALIPIVTVLGLQVGYLLGGSVIIEEVFSLPGLGKLVIDAIRGQDYPLIQGVILFIVSVFVLVNLVVDVLYAVLDPRISYGG